MTIDKGRTDVNVNVARKSNGLIILFSEFMSSKYTTNVTVTTLLEVLLEGKADDHAKIYMPRRRRRVKDASGHIHVT